MRLDAKIFVAGHRGMVGSAFCRELRRQGYRRVLGLGRGKLDLLDQRAVERFYDQVRPEFVFFAAAKVGGILANDTQPAEFIYENLQIQNNLIHGAKVAGVRKLLFLGSSCIYPRLAPQPLREEALLSGPLEPTNQWYAVAKIAGIKLCQAYRRQYGCDFICAMPTNLYGPNDSYEPGRCHVLPALIRRFHEAAVSGADSVTCWGTGMPRREFLYVDDLARACVRLMESYSAEGIVNVGYGTDVSIRELAKAVAEAVGYQGQILWDASKPDGTPRKLLDSSRIRGLGWEPEVDLKAGLAQAYRDFQGRFEGRESR